MKPLTEMILKSGLIDKHTAQVLEKWGNLPEGASDLVREDALKNATREQLVKLSEDIGEEVEKFRSFKETQLDLNALRWPVVIREIRSAHKTHCFNVPALIDAMGRFYFRVQDVEESWLIPGFTMTLLRKGGEVVSEVITEVTPLYLNDDPIAVQVSVR